MIPGVGVVLLGVVLLILFGGKKEEVPVVVRPAPAEEAPETGTGDSRVMTGVGAGPGPGGGPGPGAGASISPGTGATGTAVDLPASGREEFVLPGSMKLPGAPVPVAVLPGNPPFLQRFATAEGVLDRNLEPALHNGGEVAGWINLKTRALSHSVLPAFVDTFAERIPVSKLFTIREIPELKTATRAVSFAPRTTLVSRTGPLGLTDGFTFFLVAKLEPGTGRMVQIEPGPGGGEVAGVKIDFSANVVGSTRVGASMQESVLKLPWGGGAGVIAYGSAPGDGRHRLLSFPAGASDSAIMDGEYAPADTVLQRLFLGENRVDAASGSGQTSSLFEFVLYRDLLSATEMAEIARRLADFYFTPATGPGAAPR